MAPTLTQPLFGSGAASGRDAVPRAVGAATAALGGRRAGVVLAFPHADLDVAGAAREAAAAVPSARVLGMTGNGQISSRGPLTDGCTALALDSSVAPGVGVVERASRDFRAAGRAATAEAVAGLDLAEGRALILLFLDPDSGDYADAVAGAYEVAGPRVPLAGGGAGGRAPALLADGAALHDAVGAVAVVSSGPIGVGRAPGCSPLGDPALVTRSDGLRVLALDGRPAEAVYLERMGSGGEELTDAEFELLAATHPLGQPELRGDLRLRHVRGRAPGGGLRCATRIPENATVEVTVESPESIVASARRAAAAAVGQVERPRAVLVFDCAGRRRAAGPSLGREVEAMLECLPGLPPLAGTYTHGEVCRVRGARGDRNHAIVVVALG